MKHKLLKVIGITSKILLLVLLASILVTSFYLKKHFPMVTIDELYFYWTNGLTYTNGSIMLMAFKICIPYVILLLILYYAILYDITFGKIKLFINVKFLYKKEKKKRNKTVIKDKNRDLPVQIYPFKITNNHRIISMIFLTIFSIYISLVNLDCIDFIQNSTVKSKFIEINYVAPEKVPVTFNEKRNLIFIIVESLETTFFTKKQGGYWDYEVTPELYSLLTDEDSTTFYNQNLAEQMIMLKRNTWTTAGIVANTTALPFKVPVNGNQYHSDNFLSGAYALGDMLKDNGYYTELISSARTNFGGISEYYTKHGNFKIIDINTLKENKLKISEKEKNGWGFSDKYLFDTAKERITKIAQNDEPFFMQLITIDTHFPDGYMYNYSETKFNTQYENVYATTSKQIYDFVNWVKEQDFYENTTIVIVGDHISMQAGYFTEKGIFEEDRYIYNTYINSCVEAEKTEDRIYTGFDTYPTIISAIGGDIKGDRLGLGVNLFSNKKTLAEKYGMKKLNEEIIKKSEFYNNKILGSDYELLIQEVGVNEEDYIEEEN